MLLSLIAAASLAFAGPSACVKPSLTDSVLAHSGVAEAQVAAAVTSELQARGWSVYPMGSANAWDCPGTYVMYVGATAVQTGDVVAFTINVQAFEKMDSKLKANYWFWAQHQFYYGTWTAWSTTPGQPTSQFLNGVSQYVTTVAQYVEGQ